jgi:Fic family protein
MNTEDIPVRFRGKNRALSAFYRYNNSNISAFYRHSRCREKGRCMTTDKDSGFAPVFTITPVIANGLMQVEAVRQAILALPITPRVLAHLRETARLFSTHYSTMIEGNRLTQEQVVRAIGGARDFPGRERDRDEVRGYYAALDEVEQIVKRREPVSEATVKKLHGLTMGGGKTRVRATPYRDGQNVIRDSRSKSIVYLPPEARDVPRLMRQLVDWLNRKDELSAPLKAAIAHYQLATIHPYYDGNGRTARLLATLILHLGGYGLKGLYALEEYYARGLKEYYQSLTVGPSHNYYLGRAEADITPWVAYFIAGMADSFEKVMAEARREAARGSRDQTAALRNLDARQRRALALFRNTRVIAAKDIGELFGLKPRSTAILCRKWVEGGFLEVANSSRKSRAYRLSEAYETLIGAIGNSIVGIAVDRQ